MAASSLWCVCVLLALLPPLEGMKSDAPRCVKNVLSQGDLKLADALGGDDDSKSLTPTLKPTAPAGRAGGEFKLDDFFEDDSPTTTKAPPKVVPKLPTGTKAPVKPKPKPAADDFDLADALKPNNDIDGKDKNKGQGGEFSDSDLADIGKDDTYKPDKGKGKCLLCKPASAETPAVRRQ
ncbi:hypothetical protein PAMP_015419 [Pampus punctatissimus]